MNNIIKVVLVFSVLFAPINAVYAQRDNYYATVGDMTWAYTQGSLYAQAGSTRLIVGKYIYNTLAWEAHLAKGASNAGLTLDQTGGAFVRLNVPLWKVDVFALGGFGVSQLSTGTGSISGSSPAGGFGFQFNVAGPVGVRFDYVVYTSQANWDVKTYSVGLNYNF